MQSLGLASRPREGPARTWILGGVTAVAWLLRVLFITGQRGDVLFDFPVVDEERYVSMGRALAEGRVPDPRAWFHPPGLVYALGVIFRLAGPGLLAPRLVQAFLGAASCLLVYGVGRRWLGERVALGAASLCAVHGVLVFECYELLPPTWMLASDLLMLWLLARAKETGTPRDALAAGLSLGVAALFGPTVLPFGVVAAAWLRRPLLVSCLAAGTLVAVAPVTWGNWQRGHELVLVSTNGGINFFLGNGPDSDARLAVRPGPHWDELRDAPRRRGLGEGAASAYYAEQGLAFWRAEPWRALGHSLRKLYLFFDGPEIPRDTDILVFRSRSRLLALLVTPGPLFLPDGLIIPLALVGLGGCVRRRRGWLLVAFLVVQALVLAAFFMTSRYRVPSLPVFAMFAAQGLESIAVAWRSRVGLARAAPLAACLAGVAALNVQTRESTGHYAAELDFYRGLALRNDELSPGRALPFFEAAAREDPSDARVFFELGNTLAGLGRADDAVASWRRAAEEDPWDGRAARKAATLLGARGDLVGASAILESLVAAKARGEAYYAPDHLNLALLYARRGETSRAIDELSAAERADLAWLRGSIAGFSRWIEHVPDSPRDPSFWEALAAADARAGETAAAEAARQRAAAGSSEAH